MKKICLVILNLVHCYIFNVQRTAFRVSLKLYIWIGWIQWKVQLSFSMQGCYNYFFKECVPHTDSWNACGYHFLGSISCFRNKKCYLVLINLIILINLIFNQFNSVLMSNSNLSFSDSYKLHVLESAASQDLKDLFTFSENWSKST